MTMITSMTDEELVTEARLGHDLLAKELAARLVDRMDAGSDRMSDWLTTLERARDAAKETEMVLTDLAKDMTDV